MNIGENIKKIRIEKGLKQSDLAKIAGISREAVGNYERGDRQPNIEITNKIAAALEVSINELLGSEEMEKIKFKDDFDINIFDTGTVRYINNLKQKLKNTFPDVEINNTLVIQNMLIDQLANDAAKEKAGIPMEKLLPQFAISDGKLMTGKDLFDMLYNNYFQKYSRDRRNVLREYVERILKCRIKNTLTESEINALEEFYGVPPKSDTPIEVLEIFKKREIERATKELEELKAKGKKIEEMLNKESNE